MRWSNDPACFAMPEPLAQVLTFLMCSFLRISKHRVDRTLRNMRGHSTIAQILIILSSLTKALFALEKLWRLGTPLLPSMLTIILNQFQTSIVFFSNNSQLVYTFMFCFCSSHCFYFPFFLHIFYHFTFRFLSVEGCRLTSRKLILLFKTFLASERFYLLHMSYPGYASIINSITNIFQIVYFFIYC